MRATTNNIHKLLGITPQKYQEQDFERYIGWCESVTSNTRDFQKVIANSLIKNWYNMEMKKCELTFLEDIKGYSNASTADYIEAYDKSVVKLFSIFPKSLLQLAKKRPPVNERCMYQIGCVRLEPGFLTLN
ncbi:hypothetical protein [Flavobacterium covae]